MKITVILTSAVFVATAAGQAVRANCPSTEPPTQVAQRAIFEKFVDTFYRKKSVVEAFTNHVAVDYIQHNPNFVSGRQVAMDGLSKYIPSINITVVKTSLSENVGWVLAKQTTAAGKSYTAVVDIYRMQGSCVVEHWDVIQAQPVGAKNPLALFDGQDVTKIPF